PGPPLELSAAGSKYIDTEVENAINGVKQMKSLMEKTSKEHQSILQTLEETKKKKEEAVQLAREKEQELSEKQEVCNETMLALWEECKPCLKQSCIRFYSRTCHSGSGLVGRQLEEFLNHSSPFSIWLNGERIDSLLERDQRQEKQFEEMEERFGLLEDGVDDIFQDSTQVYGRLHPFLRPPFGGFREAFRPPLQHVRLSSRGQRFSRELHPFFHHPHRGFHHLFQPLFEMTQRMLEESQGGWDRPLGGGSSSESHNSSNERMVCREIRRNSAGCLRMRDECEKCREILNVVSPTPWCPLPSSPSSHQKWVRGRKRRLCPQLAAPQHRDRGTGRVPRARGQPLLLLLLLFFSLPLQVLSKAPNPEDPSAPPDTQVTVQLFDSEPLVLTIPGDISWEDPRFMEMVAEQALEHYKQS
ncbi:Clusterin, partial [Calypte anna]